MTEHLKKFWFILAESHELTPNNVLARQICDEWLVCFRNKEGKPAVLRDRCLHRCGRLSAGTVNKGILNCPYHGWKYDGNGKVVEIPSMGNEAPNLKSSPYTTIEQDGYIYVRLINHSETIKPFTMQYYKKSGWKNVRLQNLFQNNLANCIENFIDIPHTAFVHQGIFRSVRNEAIKADISRRQGEVHVSYLNEKQNLGSFHWLLNPHNKPILHTDSFYMPNITFVSYALESKWQYVITSQCIPISAKQTKVYTDISYRFGFITPFITWLIKRQAQKVIDQDIKVLNQQMSVIDKYGSHFYDTPSDKIHQYVSDIIQTLIENKDPILLPDQQEQITFWV